MNEISGKCPVAFALDVMGDKWSMLILRDMIFRRKSAYGDFLNSHERISTNILSNRLSKLEDAGLINKAPARKDSLRKTYALTAKGTDMLPTLLEMIAWSAKHDSYADGTELVAGAPRNLLERVQNDRDRLIAELIDTPQNRSVLD